MAKRQAASLISVRAQREIEAARAWWAKHVCTREFDDAIAAALDRLEQFPEIAPRVKRGRRWLTTRRYILDRVGYHLYYELNPEEGTILVTCFWHEQRRKPRL